jgi:hypothetical protein
MAEYSGLLADPSPEAISKFVFDRTQYEPVRNIFLLFNSLLKDSCKAFSSKSNWNVCYYSSWNIYFCGSSSSKYL